MQNKLFKALSDPTRRKILELLSEKGDLAAGEIGHYFSISPPSISHHLQILKNAGLVLDMRKGQSIIYSLNSTVFQEIVGWVYSIIKGEKEE